LADANVIVDDWEQCSHSGEINVPVTEGVFNEDDVHADLSSVVTGSASASTDEDITVFDSTGLAIQDIATAKLVYETADRQGLGTSIKLIEA
jgi:alanine dehydrogenase